MKIISPIFITIGFAVVLSIASVRASPQFNEQHANEFNPEGPEPGVLGHVSGFINRGLESIQSLVSSAVTGVSKVAPRLGTEDAAESGKRPIVYFDITADEEYLGRIYLELFSETAPRTAENFRQLATGVNGYGYKNSKFHRVIPKFMLQGGDFTNGDGTGGYSIYGRTTFEDENFIVPHASKGMLSMANAGPDTNGSQFFITVEETPWLDKKHTVFGRVADPDSFEVVKKVEALGSADGTPSKTIVIADSGQIQ